MILSKNDKIITDIVDYIDEKTCFEVLTYNYHPDRFEIIISIIRYRTIQINKLKKKFSIISEAYPYRRKYNNWSTLSLHIILKNIKQIRKEKLQNILNE